MQKIVKLNRAFLYCCMVVMFCLHSNGYAAPTQGKPVSLTIKNSTLAQVLREVSKKSGLYIYFQDADLAAHKNVTIDVREKPVESVLHELLDGRGFSWVEVGENTIAVKKKPVIEERVEGDTVATITVTGKVVDEKGTPVIGATVVVKGGTTGTTTNVAGNFILKGVTSNASLVISNVSFLTQEIAVKGRRIVGDVRLKQFVKSLDEVQIQAYGTTTRRVSTSNISTVKAADIERQPVSNPLLAIQGRVPGVFIEQFSGIAGSGVSVRIQGLNSIGKGNDPLYVIDGVPYLSQLLSTNANNILGTSGVGVGSYGAQNGNPLSFINPSDIESIDILKDADATAIYGSRAANGAVLITTKRGKAGETKVDVTVQSGFGKINRSINLLNTQEYLQLRREALKNNNNSVPSAFDYDLNGTWNQSRYTNWQKALIGGTSTYNDAKASISGGNSSTQFLMGAAYHRETTVFPGDFNDKKGAAHFSITNISPNEDFHIQFSGSYLIDENRLPGNDLTGDALRLPPNAPALYNSDGSLNWAPLPNGTSTWTNPLASFLYGTQKIKTNNLISSATISYRIIPGLDIKSNIGYNNLTSNGTNVTPLTVYLPEYRSFFQRSAIYSNNQVNSWIVEPQVTYNTQIKSGRLDLLVGTTIQESNSNGTLTRASGFSSDLILEDIGSAATISVPTTVRAKYRYNALFGRLNYNWHDKYIVNITARRDGSSRFGSENVFHNFASIGTAWVFSNEPFIKDNFSFLSFGKIRGSYGTTGNDQVGDYGFLNLYRNSNNWGVPYQGVGGLEPFGLPNPYLQWEKTRKLQLGVDLGLWNESVLFNVNYFRNRSSNQILDYSLSIVTGVDAISSNFPAKVQNSGWEFSINTINIKRTKISWSSSINLTIPQNKLLAFPNLEQSSYWSSTLVIGEPLTLTKVYHYNGVDPVTGLYQFSDKDGKLTSNPNPLTDQYVYINTTPSLYGGIHNSFTFNGFDFQFLFQFVKQKAPSNYFGNFPPGFAVNQPDNILNRWQSNGDIRSIQKVSTDFGVFTPLSAANNSDKAYSDASYIRLKNVSLSWQIPEVLKKKSHLKNCRLFVQGQNLFTITKYAGLDPETKIIYNSLPPLRTIVFGVQLSL
ncbi:SusC/RagA family TonB-linked outer membrane protein [Chitinophaga sp. CF418]|uniref:SusC/RagA family TonB-linked outer membrane protein n=1 Tax=Chitinophaga sp. CF418 TaxID=1855287 RepID=UPI000916E401|nr:SusC/RagA family TonB-linked outer membrane protein [Chitinophaga sp. CF418]SHN41854.1 TonB-linked outer membrane protein, SusC/RagA family [Chitinophaga sp. CF418]